MVSKSCATKMAALIKDRKCFDGTIMHASRYTLRGSIRIWGIRPVSSVYHSAILGTINQIEAILIFMGIMEFSGPNKIELNFC